MTRALGDEQGGLPASEAALSEDVPANEPSASSHLFGRGLLYVAVWSLQLVISSIASPILAHLLPPSEFGLLATAIAVYQVLSVLTLMGLDQALVLQRAEDTDDRSARGLVTVGIVLALIMATLIAASIPLWYVLLGFGDNPTLILIVVLWTAPAASVQVMLALLLTEDRLRSFTLLSFVSAIGGQAFGLTLLITVSDDATTYAWGGVISQTLAMVIAIALTRPRLGGLRDLAVARRAITIGIPLALAALASFVLNAGDRVVIQVLLGPAEVGRYQIAYVLGSVVILLLSITSSAWTPRFAALRDERDRWALASHSRDELYRLLLPALVGITFGAPVALMIVAPASYTPETLLPVVFVIALSAFPFAASGATGRLLITLRRGKTLGLIAAVAAVGNIGLNILLVPPLGIMGAALSTLIAYMVLALLQQLALPRRQPWPRPGWKLIIGFIAVAAICAVTLVVPPTLPWNFARFAVALACLPWFVLRLRRARSGGPEAADAPTTGVVGAP